MKSVEISAGNTDLEHDMKILVVGGTRFFGIPMVNALLASGHDVTIATRGNAKADFAGEVKSVVFDRTDFPTIPGDFVFMSII